MEKTCTVCGKESSPYKCPKCSFLYCSVACCKVHKETCTSPAVTRTDNEIISVSLSPSLSSSSSKTESLSLNDKLSSSSRLQSFLSSTPYLSSHLPVLLARIDRHDTSPNTNTNNSSSSSSDTSKLARELERKERIAEVLKEAIETDPKVAELYQILQEEDII